MNTPQAAIEAAAATDNGRYSLNAVQLDVEKKRLLATDGHILASIPVVPAADDHSGLIPVDAFKAARRMQRETKQDAMIAVNGSVRLTAGNVQAEFQKADGTFPNWERVMMPAKGRCTIAFDVDLLVRLAKAIDTRDTSTQKSRPRYVEFWVKDQSSAIAVKVQGCPDDSIGVLMPVRS